MLACRDARRRRTGPPEAPVHVQRATVAQLEISLRNHLPSLKAVKGGGTHFPNLEANSLR
jgi:hypothetical protein